MIFIFVGSTDLMSSEHTSRFLVPFLRWLSPGISEATLATAQLFVRKCAHVGEYAILAALFFRAFSQGKMTLGRAAGSAFMLAGSYAILDEFHQSFVLSRTASPYDVAIDLAGAATGLLIYWCLTRRVGLNQQSKI